MPIHSARAMLWVLVGGLLVLYLVAFALSASSRLLRPLDEVAYGESWLLDDARRLARGESLYRPPTELPIVHSAYMPLYPALVGLLVRTFGDAGYTPGRAVSLVAALAAAACLALSIRSITSRWRYGLLAGALFLTQNLTALLWAPLHRVDMLALAFAVAGVGMAAAGRPRLSVLLFVLSFFSKQTFVIAPLAVCLSLWPCRREMAIFSGLFGGAVLLGMALGEWLSGGWFVWHTLVANSNTTDYDTFAVLIGSFLQFNGLFVLAAAANLFLPGSPAERPWRLYFVLSLATLPALAKVGASSNYWLEVSAATAAMLGFLSYRLARIALDPGDARDRLFALLPPMLLAGGLFFALPAYQATVQQVLGSLRDAPAPGEPAYLSLVGDSGYAPLRVDASLVERLADEPGEVLSDNSGLVVASGKRLAFEFQIFQLLHGEGRWQQQPILDAIRAQRFALVALMHPLEVEPVLPAARWTTEQRAALIEAYRPAGELGGFWLYRPAPSGEGR